MPPETVAGLIDSLQEASPVPTPEAEFARPTGETTGGEMPAWMNRPSGAPASDLTETPTWLADQASARAVKTAHSAPGKSIWGGLKNAIRLPHLPARGSARPATAAAPAVEPARLTGETPSGEMPTWMNRSETPAPVLTGTPEWLTNVTAERERKTAEVLQNKRAFGKSIAEFALTKGAVGGIKWGGRELSKQIFSLVAGGLTGGPASAAFAGAVVGGAWAYALQVNRNINKRMAEAEMNNPELAERRRNILRRNISKIKELRNGEVFTKDISRREILKGVIFGAAAGAGGQALVSHIPAFSEFIAEHAGGLRSLLAPIDQAVGNINTETIGSGLGKAGEFIGEQAGNISHGAGEMAGGISKTAGDTWSGLGGVKDTAGSAVHGVRVLGGIDDAIGATGKTIGDTAGSVWQGAGEQIGKLEHAVGIGGVHEAGQQAFQEAGQQAAGEAVGAPEGFVPQADYDALNQHLADTNQQLTDANKTIADLQQQLAAAKQAASGIHEAAGAAAAEQAATAHDTLLDAINPTNIHGHVIAGSVLDHNLTYDGATWHLLENGTKNIEQLLSNLGETNAHIDQQALAEHLQRATGLWAHNQLTDTSHHDLRLLFDVANGTGLTELVKGNETFEELVKDKDALDSLKNLGIFTK